MYKKAGRAFVGRFQPFHKGHLAALKYIAARSSKVVVAIGSAQYSIQPGNPFSASERRRMMAAQLREAGLSGKCRLFTLTDIHNDAKWVAHVDANLPRYDVCFSNNALVLKLMRKAGKEVARVPFFRKGTYNATKIRERMRGRRSGKSGACHRHIGRTLARLKADERVGRL